MIEAPQLLINYLGGSCGEWLAIKMAQHDKYYNLTASSMYILTIAGELDPVGEVLC